MKIVIDDVTKTLELVSKDEAIKLDLYGPEAYQLIAKLWMKTSWNQKYPYTFTWMGRPVIATCPLGVGLPGDPSM